eukprot:4762063-Amphidinium_carterae.2
MASIYSRNLLRFAKVILYSLGGHTPSPRLEVHVQSYHYRLTLRIFFGLSSTSSGGSHGSSTMFGHASMTPGTVSASASIPMIPGTVSASASISTGASALLPGMD